MNSRIDIHADFRSLKVRTQPTSRWTLGLMARLLTAVNALHRRRFKTIVSVQEFAGTAGNVVPVLIVRPPDLTPASPALIYYHGGAFIFKHAPQHLENAVKYSREANCCVIMVDYRLAPAHPFPAAFDDCYDTLRWALSHADEVGIDRQRVAVGGDSAGGTLAAAVAQKAVHEDRIELCGQLLIYPATDVDCQRPSTVTYADFPPFKAASRGSVWQVYLGHPLSEGLPRYASPIDGDLHGLSPAYVEIAQFDVLHDQGLAYAQALREQRVDVELNEIKGAVHGFDLLVARSSVSQAAMQSRINFLRRVFSPRVSDGSR
jgi:acetyl esterase